MPCVLAETPRLRLRELQLADAPLVLRLLNEPGFHRYIGDKGVRDLVQAEAYLRDGPLASYRAHGFGLWCVERHADGAAVGMVGLLRRDWLAHVDIGYALLAESAGHGYAREAAEAVCRLAAQQFGLNRLLAIVNHDNAASIRLLEALGFAADGEVTAPGAAAPIRQFARDLPPAPRAIGRERAPHYRWGAVGEGWRLLDAADLSVIEECLPPGGSEQRHRHQRARQCFYVLSGEAIIEVEGERIRLVAGQSLHVAPGAAHCFRNEGTGPVRFLVISAPSTRGDREPA